MENHVGSTHPASPANLEEEHRPARSLLPPLDIEGGQGYAVMHGALTPTLSPQRGEGEV
jgi:hypothetical protein